MLNRYGLFDIEAMLNEQGGGDLSQFQAQHGDTIHSLAQDHTQIGKMKGTGYMAGRFKKMGANDSAAPIGGGGLAGGTGGGMGGGAPRAAVTDKRGDRDAARQTLRSAHEKAGMKAPFHKAFDQKTTGLSGQQHIGVIAYLHDGEHKPGKNNTGQITMQSPGDAQAMMKAGGSHHSNLSFMVNQNQPSIVSYKPAPAQQAPQQPTGAATGGPMGAPTGTPAPPGPPMGPAPLY